jgi:hypothetical protein
MEHEKTNLPHGRYSIAKVSLAHPTGSKLQPKSLSHRERDFEAFLDPLSSPGYCLYTSRLSQAQPGKSP